MKKNVGAIDRVLRIIVAIILVALYLADVVAGTLGFVLLAAAVIFVLTSASKFCGLYAIFGIKTCKTD
jgi:nitrate/TMAO reductase-like tetraheme cytochrome c subunit